jgi:phosphoenolpyruvate-protein phosphotransferase (PTS system enzyme I)
MLSQMPDNRPSGEQTFQGIAASAGVCQGRVVVFGKTSVPSARHAIPEGKIPEEIHRFEQALVRTRQQLTEVQRRLAEKSGDEHASIFESHLLVLDDPEVNNEVLQTIQKQKVNAEYAYQTVAERYATSLAAVDDEYLRERAADLRDITARVLNNLLGQAEDADVLRKLKEPCIVVAHDLAPSQTAQMERNMVLGFATDVGSRTSHTAIMAGSLKIPAVVGLKTITANLTTGDYVLLDGFKGLIIVNPTEQTLYAYGRSEQRRKPLDEKLRDSVPLPAITLDGHRVILSGNIEHPSDAKDILESGAEGVGLFRTEYLYINHESLPTEQEQYEAYRAVVEALKPAPVVIRTLDLGGDKFRSHTEVPDEMNSVLGWRAIRFCLEEKDIFRTQLRAILRASAHGNVKMMYPMISGLNELLQANALLDECKAELRQLKLPFDEQLEVGSWSRRRPRQSLPRRWPSGPSFSASARTT